MKKNIKLILGLITGLLLGGITAYAATKVTAQEVTYTNSKLSGVTNVKGAIDSLYTKASNLTCPIGYNCKPKYYVSYNACSGSGAPTQTTHTYGVSSNISSTKPTRSNYTFQGWSKSSCSGSVDLSSGASVTNLSSTPGATVTLYAIWKSDTCELQCANGFYATYNSSGTMIGCRYSGTYGSAVCNGGTEGSAYELYMCQFSSNGKFWKNLNGLCNASLQVVNTHAGGCPETYTCP